MHSEFAKSAGKNDLEIVGAGIAGLTAALALIEMARAENLPLPRIEILEAGNEEGGRATSASLAGSIVNLGGQWFHDMTGNPFYLWVKNRYPDLTYSDDHVQRDIIMNEDGRQPPDYYAGLYELLGSAYRKYKETNPDKDISLADLVPLVGDPIAPVLAEYVARNWMTEDNLSLISCDELFKENSYGPGGPQCREGMSVIVGRMADELRADGVVIRTATPVSAADQTGENVIMSSPDGRAFESAAGLVTASAGVMKKGLIDFRPALAAPITDYFNGLTMGKMTKVILPLNDEFFERRGIQPNTFVSVMTNENKTFCHARSGGAPVIEIFSAGAEAEELERHPETAAAFAARFFAALGGYFDGYEECMAGPPLVTGFNTNPYILGSYSALKPGSKRSDPMRDGRLFFAGEAFITTDEKGYEPSATMSAAWSSGRKVAADIFPVIRPLLEARKAPAPV